MLMEIYFPIYICQKTFFLIMFETKRDFHSFEKLWPKFYERTNFNLTNSNKYFYSLSWHRPFIHLNKSFALDDTEKPEGW